MHYISQTTWALGATTLLIMAAILGSPARAGLIDDFEDGDATQNPAWGVLNNQGPYSVVWDPVRPTNYVLKAHGSAGGHLALATSYSMCWQGFVFSVEYMASNGTNYGPLFMVSGNTYNLGTWFPTATTVPDLNGRWFVADNTSVSDTWLERDPNAPAYVLPAWVWVRIQIAHDPVDGLIHGSVVQVSDGAVLIERTYSPSAPVPMSSITQFILGIEEIDWQYVDNIYLDFVPHSGDLNCDGDVDLGDINPFVLCLSNFSAWQATYPGCPAQNGDINGDGTYGQGSFGDINPFVALLTGQL